MSNMMTEGWNIPSNNPANNEGTPLPPKPPAPSIKQESKLKSFFFQDGKVNRRAAFLAFTLVAAVTVLLMISTSNSPIQTTSPKQNKVNDFTPAQPATNVSGPLISGAPPDTAMRTLPQQQDPLGTTPMFHSSPAPVFTAPENRDPAATNARMGSGSISSYSGQKREAKFVHDSEHIKTQNPVPGRLQHTGIREGDYERGGFTARVRPIKSVSTNNSSTSSQTANHSVQTGPLLPPPQHQLTLQSDSYLAQLQALRQPKSDESSVIKRGTRIRMRLLENVVTGAAAPARAVVIADVLDVAGKVIIPKGTEAEIPFQGYDANGRIPNSKGEKMLLFMKDGAQIQSQGTVKGLDGRAGLQGKVTLKGGPSWIKKALGAGMRHGTSVIGGPVSNIGYEAADAAGVSTYSVSNGIRSVEVQAGTDFIFIVGM
jgi:hypothetical protein